MGSRAFVDTNVLVYAVDTSESAKCELARTLLDSRHADLVVSAQVLSEFYVTVTRKLARPMSVDEASAAVGHLSALPAVAIDDELALAAIEISRDTRISYWDGLIVAAARSAGCAVVLSEDLSEGQTIASVRVENPFSASAGPSAPRAAS